MTEKPSVSVVMATHNRDQQLGRALDSLLQQTFQPDEIIVIDDASTDQTARVVEMYSEKYACIRHFRLGCVDISAQPD